MTSQSASAPVRGVRAFAVLVVTAGLMLAPSAANAGGAVISNGIVQLGVNPTGDLNFSCVVNTDPGCPGPSASGTDAVGLRYVPQNLDSIAPGCLCEGWGLADATSLLSGYANEDAGTANVTVNNFTRSADGQSAVSDVTISDGTIAGYEMHVIQDYHPSTASPNLYEDTVTVTNTGANAIADLRYRRLMDWDIEPTAFSEWVTLQGTSPQLLYTSDDGFQTADPLGPRTTIDSESVCGTGYTGVCNFTDLGSGGTFPTVTTPDDHGALFDFGFGALGVSETKTFKVYYGAAPTETDALNALSLGGAQVYSLGESSCPTADTTAGCDSVGTDGGVLGGKPATFMFGFVTTTGDVSITKTDSPDPATVGQDLTYTLTVHNNGPEDAAGVSVSDPLPAGVTYKSATPSAGGTCSGTSTVTCTFPSIANNASATVTIVVTPTSAGSLNNTASVTTASADANPSNNSASAGTTVNPAGGGVTPPTMSINDVSVTEGDSGTKPAVFAVTLSKTSTSTVTAHFATADGTAHAPGDYTASSGTVTFNPGDTSKSVSVAVKGDTLSESNETFHVDLSSPSNATLADAQGIGTILDDDVSGPGVVSGLFCGVKHRGKCKGNPFKGIADRPGNAVWTFGAYNPKKGAPPSAVAAKSKLLKLGTVKTIVKKRGVFKVVFKLKAGAKTKKLYKQAVKLKVKVLRVKVVLTGPGGFRQVKESDFKLKL